MSTFKADPSYDSLSPQTTKGDLAVYGAAGSTRLPVGADGLFLKADSTQTLGIAWASPAGAVVGFTTTAVSLSLTIATDVCIVGNTGTSIDIQLPDLATSLGKIITVQKRFGMESAGNSGVVRLVGATSSAFFVKPGAGPSFVNGLTMSTATETYRLLAANSSLWLTLDHRTNFTFSYTPTSFGGVGTPSLAFFNCSRNGKWLNGEGMFIAGTVGASLFYFSLPNQLQIDSTWVNDQGHTTTQSGAYVGQIQSSAGSAYAALIACTGTSATVVYGGPVLSGTTPFIPAAANGYIGTATQTGVRFSIPIIGWDD